MDLVIFAFAFSLSLCVLSGLPPPFIIIIIIIIILSHSIYYHLLMLIPITYFETLKKSSDRFIFVFFRFSVDF